MIQINWGDKLKEMGILWQYSGDPTKPHALWTSGLHADTFNNGSKLLEDPKLLEEVTAGMIGVLSEEFQANKPDWVVGPAMGAVTIGHEIARQLGTKFAFTEPVHTEEGKMQVLKRFDISDGAKALVVEDALSTGGSIKKTIAVLESAGVEVLPFVATIVNWSGSDEIDGRKVYSLFADTPKKWQPEECELCKAGSEALRPKANWDKFVN